MGTVLREISEGLRKFIEGQRIFFVATAPAGAEGHVNVSPKGMDSLRVLGPTRVAYLDLTGSGNETAAHVMQNGRITLMFCAFEGKPLILRVYGRGRVILPGEMEWKELAANFTMIAGVRQIIVVEATRVQTSCGFAVPRMAFKEERQELVKWAEGKGEDGLREYRAKKNRLSIDEIMARGHDG